MLTLIKRIYFRSSTTIIYTSFQTLRLTNSIPKFQIFNFTRRREICTFQI